MRLLKEFKRVNGKWHRKSPSDGGPKSSGRR